MGFTLLLLPGIIKFRNFPWGEIYIICIKYLNIQAYVLVLSGPVWQIYELPILDMLRICTRPTQWKIKSLFKVGEFD